MLSSERLQVVSIRNGLQEYSRPLRSHGEYARLYAVVLRIVVGIARTIIRDNRELITRTGPLVGPLDT